MEHNVIVLLYCLIVPWTFCSITSCFREVDDFKKIWRFYEVRFWFRDHATKNRSWVKKSKTNANEKSPRVLLSHHSPQQHARLEWCPHAANSVLMFLGVDWLFKCFVVYLRAFNRDSALGGGCCCRNFTQPLTSTEEERQKAPEGCTQSYRMIRPTMTRRTKSDVSSRLNWATSFLKGENLNFNYGFVGNNLAQILLVT